MFDRLEDTLVRFEELLSMLGQLPGSNMSQIYTMAFLLSLVVMGTCVMMISSSLNSNVSQRMEFFGLLRCLGATRRQVCALCAVRLYSGALPPYPLVSG